MVTLTSVPPPRYPDRTGHDEPFDPGREKVGDLRNTYNCYRVVISNYDLRDAAEVTVRIYSPHINTLYPASGSKNGGYPLEIGEWIRDLGPLFPGDGGRLELPGHELDR